MHTCIEIEAQFTVRDEYSGKVFTSVLH